MRCRYCLPNGSPPPLPRGSILNFEEIARVIRVGAALGITRVRFTGGEPLLRRDLHRLVAMTRAIDGIETIALTTNALLLGTQLSDLVKAGMTAVSISIDSVRRDVFREMTGSDDLPKVMSAIDAAVEIEELDVELNAVAVKGTSEPEIVPLVEYAREKGVPIRFIELMPFEDVEWRPEVLLAGHEIEAIIAEAFGEGSFTETTRSRPAAPARRFKFSDSGDRGGADAGPSREREGTAVARGGGFGLIEPVSNPFCAGCDRLRLRSDGQLFNCLFGRIGYDLRAAVRAGTDETVRALLRKAVVEKGPGGMLEFQGQVENRARIMASIGG
jgi:cyclic pyranopterin phosphate synthase